VHALQSASPILQAEALVRPGVDLNRTVTDLVDTRFAASLKHA
jgi:sulfonate transport system substrate-binding protein